VTLVTSGAKWTADVKSDNSLKTQLIRTRIDLIVVDNVHPDLRDQRR